MSELLCVMPKQKAILKVKDWKYKKDNPSPLSWATSGNSSIGIGHEALMQGMAGDGRNAVGYSALNPLIVNGVVVGSSRSYGSLHINTPTEQSISFKPNKQ